MPNVELKNEIKKSGIKQWQIADYLKISEATFTRRMRHELTKEKSREIFKIIEELRREGNLNANN